MFWTMSHEWPGVGEMWTMNETIQINITIVTCNMLYNYNTKTKTLNKKHRFKLYVALHRGGTVVNLNTSRFQFNSVLPED